MFTLAQVREKSDLQLHSTEPFFPYHTELEESVSLSDLDSTIHYFKTSDTAHDLTLYTESLDGYSDDSYIDNLGFWVDTLDGKKFYSHVGFYDEKEYKEATGFDWKEVVGIQEDELYQETAIGQIFLNQYDHSNDSDRIYYPIYDGEDFSEIEKTLASLAHLFPRYFHHVDEYTGDEYGHWCDITAIVSKDPHNPGFKPILVDTTCSTVSWCEDSDINIIHIGRIYTSEDEVWLTWNTDGISRYEELTRLRFSGFRNIPSEVKIELRGNEEQPF